MASRNFTIEIKGVKEAFDKITTNFNKASDEIDMEMAAGVEKILRQAKSLLSVDNGRLRSSLENIKIAKYHYRYGSSVNYAAYVEFGTGKYAAEYVPSIDPEWQKLALSYKTSNPGTLQKNPYLYPATQTGQKEILANIKKVIKKYV